MKIKFTKHCTILFQGDSITDCKRFRLIKSHMGFGYCSMIKKHINQNFEHMNIKCINKGLYGDTSAKLQKRWGRTTLKESPDILSLLIGINDTWRRYDRNRITPENTFYDNYSFLLESTLKAKSNTQLVIMSPFLLPVKDEQNMWFEDLNPKIEIIEKLAKENNAIYIPLRELFLENITEKRDVTYWTRDGVHPTKAGHELIAKQWILSTGLDSMCDN